MTALLAIGGGLALLVWSADRFVDGAAASSHRIGVPPLLIGMVVLGFGTSAPELVVSFFAGISGNSGLALGNAYGSNVANIGLILGLTALIKPIGVHSGVLRKELPILTAVTVFGVALLVDGELTRRDGILHLAVFAGLMGWTIWQGLRGDSDHLEEEVMAELEDTMSLPRAVAWMVVGLVLLVVSSRLLVWGAVEVARNLGVSDLLIGLTIVALGTSLPELAASLTAIRKGEHELALGNVIGSNLFNTLAVVGLATSIHPLPVARDVALRDSAVMGLMTVSLFIFGFGFRGPGRGRINRFEGAILVAGYIAYMIALARSAAG